MILLLLAYVYAVGEIYTQTQIDNINFTNVNLNYTFGNYKLIDNNIIKSYSFDYLKRYNESHYIAMRPVQYLTVERYDLYLWCKTMFTLQECNSYIKINFMYKMLAIDQRIREGLNSFQSKETTELDIN